MKKLILTRNKKEGLIYYKKIGIDMLTRLPHIGEEILLDDHSKNYLFQEISRSVSDKSFGLQCALWYRLTTARLTSIDKVPAVGLKI